MKRASEIDLNVLSLGAGVQSSTLLALAAADALPDTYARCDHAIFADTGNEPVAVYEWLDTVLQPMADRAGIELIRVSCDNTLGEEMTGEGDYYRTVAPLWTAGGGALPRTCTYSYKIEPIRREVRRILGVKKGRYRNVDMMIGISRDEVTRIKPSGLEYINNRYPLVDMGWSRQDCIDYMVDEGYGEPPRSACVFCPYRSNTEWREMQSTDYASFLQAIDFDESVRARKHFDEDVFVHKSRLPLINQDFRIDDGGSQMTSECSGFCGV